MSLLIHPVSRKYQTLFQNNGVDTYLRLCHFFAQAQHESKLQPRQESLNYSVSGLLKTFGRHRISREDCFRYGRSQNRAANQEAIANLVYGGEWGKKNLGNTCTGDGYKYRGRGIFQITGRSNYTALSIATGVDYVNHPDWLLREADSLIAALWYWSTRKCNVYADRDNILAVSRIINLGSASIRAMPHGYNARVKWLNYYKQKLK